MEDKLRNERNFIIATVVALAANTVFLQFVLPFVNGYQIGSLNEWSNVRVYIISIVLFLVVFFVSFKVLTKLIVRDSREMRPSAVPIAFWLTTAGLFVLVIASVVFFDNIPYNNAPEYFWHRLPVPVLISSIVLLFCGFFFFTGKLGVTNKPVEKNSNVAYWLVCIVMLLLVGVLQYYPNSFIRPTSITHVHAYFNSIYNAFHGVPYSMEVGSIYGHYAIFYVPLLKITSAMGVSDIFSVFLQAETILLCIGCLLGFYCIHVFVKNKIVKCLAAISLPLVLFALQVAPYYQLHPHRTIPISVFMAIVAFAVSHKEKIRMATWIGYIICMFLIIWNTETGLVAAVAWACFLICLNVQKYKISNPAFWGYTGLYVIAAILSFLGAVALTGLYNLSLGGNFLGIKEFIFPLLSSGFDVGALQTPLYAGLTYWLLIMSVFFIFAAKAISSTTLCNKKALTDFRGAAYAGLSVMGLGAFSYFINRTAIGNMFITHMLVVVLVSVIAQRCFPAMRILLGQSKNAVTGMGKMPTTIFRAAVGLTAVFMLFLTMLASVIGMGQNAYMFWELRDTTAMELYAEEIERKIPSDTKGMGRGVVEMYAYLGWNTAIYLMDFTDLRASEESFEHACDVLAGLENESLLTTVTALSRFEKDAPEVYEGFMESHKVVETINLGGVLQKKGLEDFIDHFEYYVPLSSKYPTDTLPPVVEKIEIRDAETDSGVFYAAAVGVTDPSRVSGVEFAVWSDRDGQDDLKWYSGTYEGENTWNTAIDTATDHQNDKGVYHIHVYATDGEGNRGCVDTTTVILGDGGGSALQRIVKTQDPDSSSLFYITAEGVTDPDGISTVEFAVWSDKNGQEDLEWYHGVNVGDGNWSVGVNTINHQNDMGLYHVHVYATDNLGIREFIGGKKVAL